MGRFSGITALVQEGASTHVRALVPAFLDITAQGLHRRQVRNYSHPGFARSRTQHLASGMMLIGQRMSSHVGQDSDPALNRMCLRNATNSLAPVTCALHMEANDIMALATVSTSSSEMISNFEMAGNSGKRGLGELPWISGSDSDGEVTIAASGARPPYTPAPRGQ